MPLAAGTRLGPYEIVAPLGAGGTGEVYRARDTRLGRDVAIKTLPDAFISDPERTARRPCPTNDVGDYKRRRGRPSGRAVRVKPSSAFPTEPPSQHHALQERRRRVRGLAKLLEHDVRDVVRRVEAHEVQQRERS